MTCPHNGPYDSFCGGCMSDEQEEHRATSEPEPDFEATLSLLRAMLAQSNSSARP